MSAFAMVALKSPSLLAFDRERTAGNWHTLYGIQRVPCDTHLREILDPVSPEALRPVFKRVVTQFHRSHALEPMRFFADSYFLALDGPGSFSSKAMHCASCLQQRPRAGTLTSAHQMVGAAMIHLDVRAVMPLRPAPIVPQDGTRKNDCARLAAKRFRAQLRHDSPHLNFIITADSLRANAPPIETLHAHHLHAILGVQAGEPAWLFPQVEAADRAGRVTQYTRHDRSTGLVHRFRFVHQGPLNASHANVHVNFIEDWETHNEQVQHCSWVTDSRVNQRNVSPLMRGGRARWKIATETCHTLKNQGSPFAHT